MSIAQKCKIDGCFGKLFNIKGELKTKKGFCQKHYRKLRLYGDPTVGYEHDKEYPSTCTVHKCGKPYTSKGMCNMHYLRFKIHGDASHPDTRYTHRATGSYTYVSWGAMKQRCYNKNSKSYNWYGGRGIKVCDRWIDSYDNFLKDMGERPKGMTLDRKNPDGDYTPENCRWADVFTQAQNKNNTRNVKSGEHLIKLTQSGRFQVRFTRKRKTYYFGTYDRLSDAIVARDAGIIKIDGYQTPS